MFTFLIGLLLPISLYFGFIALRKWSAGGKCPKHLLKNAEGKVFCVTGGTSGLGREVSRNLLKYGAKKLIIACRNRQKGEKTIKELQKFCWKGSIIELKILDLSTLSKIDEFVKEFTEDVDVFIMNAATIPRKRITTDDGLEIMFGTNHIGNHYLCSKLFERWSKYGTRVVVVSSHGHKMVKELELDMDKVFSPRKDMEGMMKMMVLYGFSKLCNILFCMRLNEDFKRSGSKSKCVALHPGGIKTNLGVSDDDSSFVYIFTYYFSRFIFLFVGKTVTEGIQTHLYCALEDNEKLIGGGYYADCKESKTNPSIVSKENANKLWDFSNKVVEKIKNK